MNRETGAVTPTSRRTVLGLAAAVGAGGLVAACGGGSETPTADDSSAGTTASGSGEQSGTGDAGGDMLAKTADVPVGSGVILADAKVVVTQPTAGEFKAFSSTCTHQSCQVSGLSGDRITCPCHGSSFSIADGTPEGGPARSPLPEVGITVEGDSVVRA